MSKAIFFYIACLLLLLPLIFGVGEISFTDQLLFTTPFLLVLGIPHGAVDNVLYLRNNSMKNAHFIGIYLLFVGFTVALWLLLPKLAYLLFLLISAYHFGQSQFCHYFNRQTSKVKLLYSLWGISILSGLLYLNSAEVYVIMDQYPEFSQFRILHQEKVMLYLFSSSTIASIAFIAMLAYQKSLKLETMFMEFLVMLLILTAFFLLPLMIGFTFYFIILHSYKVLREEYQFLKKEQVISSIRGFISLVAPFTLMSILGIASLFALIYFDLITLSYGYCLLIVISAITLPHALVMNRFYQLLLKR